MGIPLFMLGSQKGCVGTLIKPTVCIFPQMQVHQSHFPLKHNLFSTIMLLWHYNICSYMFAPFPANILGISYTPEYLARWEVCIPSSRLRYLSDTVWGKRFPKWRTEKWQRQLSEWKYLLKLDFSPAGSAEWRPEEELKHTLPPFCMLFDSRRLLLLWASVDLSAS